MKKNKGFTLIELLLVLGVTTIIGGGIFMSYQKKVNAVKATALVQMARDMDKSVQSCMSSATDSQIAANLNNTGVKACISPQYLDNNSIVNNYGGAVTFSGETYAGSTVYRMKMENIPSLACVRAAIQLGSDSLGVVANGGIVKTTGSTTDSDPALASTFCIQASNTVEVVRSIQLPKVTADEDTSLYFLSGKNAPNIGKTSSYLVPDLSNSLPSNFDCTPDTISGNHLSDHGCTCPEGYIWGGKWCVIGSTSARINGVTVGTAVPTTPTSATAAMLKAGVTSGTADPYNTLTKQYTHYYYPTTVTRTGVLPEGDAATIAVSATNLSITGYSGTGSDSATAYCVNGQVWNGTVCADSNTFNYAGGSATINRVWDTSKYKTCYTGTYLDNGRCQMPTDTSTIVANTVLQNPVAFGDSNTCSNGQSWNGSSCACTGGTTLNSRGWCACASGTRYNKDSQTCVASSY